MHRNSLFPASCLLLAALTLGPPARAQEQTAAARTLYDEGSSLMAAGRIAEACPKFEASIKLEPRLGTRFQLAACYEQIGRTATAWAMYADLAAQAQKDGKPTEAESVQARADKLLPRLTRLLVKLDPTLEALSGLRVERDRTEVPFGMFGVAVPVDPGTHVIEAAAPGRKKWSQVIKLSQEGEVQEILVPALPAANDSAVPPTRAPETPGKASTTTVVAPSAPNPARTNRVPRLLGWVGLGVGALGAGVGTALLVAASNSWSNAKSDCDATNHCGPTGLDLRRQATSRGDLATVFYTVGGISAAAGVVLLLTARSHSTSGAEMSLGVGPGSLAFMGRF